MAKALIVYGSRLGGTQLSLPDVHGILLNPSWLRVKLLDFELPNGEYRHGWLKNRRVPKFSNL